MTDLSIIITEVAKEHFRRLKGHHTKAREEETAKVVEDKAVSVVSVEAIEAMIDLTIQLGERFHL